MRLTPTQFSRTDPRRRISVELPRRQAPTRYQKVQNPKWTDDAWFEKRYGDPEYYTRVKGLS